ncbi:hypothetical protein [Rosistilla oblonga]|uniref:hypothetical protein n=1 Tax=Rosistilla oblonga TaxID=2527990 RepID=UPI003A96BD7E
MNGYPKLFRSIPFLPALGKHYREIRNIRNQAKGKWHDLFRKGTLCITGFWYYTERAKIDGFPYCNTLLSGTGNQYPYPHSKFLAGEDSYALLTFDRGARTMTVKIKGLDGDVLERKEFEKR